MLYSDQNNENKSNINSQIPSDINKLMPEKVYTQRIRCCYWIHQNTARRGSQHIHYFDNPGSQIYPDKRGSKNA